MGMNRAELEKELQVRLREAMDEFIGRPVAKSNRLEILSAFEKVVGAMKWKCYAKPAELDGKTCGHQNEAGIRGDRGTLCCEGCGATIYASEDRRLKEVRHWTDLLLAARYRGEKAEAMGMLKTLTRDEWQL